MPIEVWGPFMGNKNNNLSKTTLRLVFALLLMGVCLQVQLAVDNDAHSFKTAFRIESFVRSLETSGIDGQSRIYHFRGRNLADGNSLQNGHPATQRHLSVTSS